MEKNIYVDKAFRLINSGRSLFVTGKAGTGKTTLLRKVVERAKNNKKKVVVLAPTGVAAQNADGVTIHSFLHLPLAPYIPGFKTEGLYKLKQEQKELVRSLHLIIIDEISMVRCDLMDMMDDVLRFYRKSDLPFGGIQMVFFGDLYQLMPVVKTEEKEKLLKHYESVYFFSSKVYEKMNCPMLKLEKVYRQTNGGFIKLLNHIRIGMALPVDLKMLMSRYKPNFVGSDKTIRLTTHNHRAKYFNQMKLDSLSAVEKEYKAYIESYFPKEEWPADYCLRLKKGARVMFIKNDPEEGYVNGTLGTVSGLYYNEVEVKTDEGNIIKVNRQKWDKLKYVINKKTKIIETEVCGSFSQFPLKFAWAVTIHKSQGLTFDEVIIDAGRAFTYGQVYVALSRCRRFHGVTLVSPITPKSIMVDPVVTKFMNKTSIIEVGKSSDDGVLRKLNLTDTEERTYWMAKEGLTIEEMVAGSGERIEIIYSHLRKLIAEKVLSVDSYINKEKYAVIKKAIMKVGFSADLKKIMECCPKGIMFNEILLVKTSLEAKNKQHDLLKENTKGTDEGFDDDWHFVSNVSIFKWSDSFFDETCRVGMAKDGYYLFVIDEYIKLGDYPASFTKNKGWLSVSFLGKNHLKIVHIDNGREHLIGTLKKDSKQIVFITPQNEEKVITFE